MSIRKKVLHFVYNVAQKLQRSAAFMSLLTQLLSTNRRSEFTNAIFICISSTVVTSTVLLFNVTNTFAE